MHPHTHLSPKKCLHFPPDIYIYSLYKRRVTVLSDSIQIYFFQLAALGVLKEIFMVASFK